MGLVEQNVTSFLDKLASSHATPGGGSVSALAGSLGVALVEMVSRVTIGKKKYATVEDDMNRILPLANALRTTFVGLVERDAAAFDDVMKAFALPKDSDDDKKRRAEAIEMATQHATLVPLDVMQACGQAMQLSAEVAKRGNSNAVSDAGVSALMIHAACRGAYYNVMINAGSLKDEAFIRDVRARANSLMKRIDLAALAVQAHVESTMHP